VKHRFLVSALSVLILAACGEEKLVPSPETPPVDVHVQSQPTPKPKPPEAAPWVPSDADILGRWAKPCAKSATGSQREEIYFIADRILIETLTFSDDACGDGKRLRTQTTELAFEDGWEALIPKLNGVFVKGWRGTFRDESRRPEYVDYEVTTHLAEEAGQKVLYIHWSETKPVELDAARDRYVFVGFSR
jgi:hypothetical protein